MSDASVRQTDPASESSFRSLLLKAGLSRAAFTEACTELFLVTLRTLKQKQADQDTLSSSVIVIVTLLVARSIVSKQQFKFIRGSVEELELLRSWGHLVSGDWRHQFDALVRSYFGEEPHLEVGDRGSTSSFGKLQFGPGLRRTIEKLGGVGSIDVATLFSTLLSDTETGISKNISKFELGALAARMLDESKLAQSGRNEYSKDPPQIERVDQDPHASDKDVGTRSLNRPGRLAAMVREARAEELALGINDFALALSTILRSANGEFTFALFGRWGSGKTTLVSVLAPLMRNTGAYKIAIVATDSTPYTNTSYEVIFHNAWKYRSPPEAWVFLYKSIADSATRTAGFFGSLSTAVRTSIEKNGPWPITAAILVLVLAMVPPNATLQIVALAGSVISFTILMHLASVTVGISSKVRELFTKHMRLTGSDEKLGMLALIGDDVKALVKGWTAPPPKDLREKIGERSPLGRIAVPAILVAIVSALWGYGLFQAGDEGNIGSNDLLPSWLGAFQEMLNTVIQKRWNEAPNGADWSIWAVWTLCALLTLILPNLPVSKRPDRLLLVVDDLDRCEPEEMLGVIEGIKLLLDDRQISARLQVLMLVDEQVLNHAIALRYELMISERAASATQEEARTEVIAEQKEKLFACHLRLPNLSALDVETLVDNLANYQIIQGRNEQQRLEEQRLKREREAALREQREAQEEYQKAEASYRSVEQGTPRQRVNIDQPSRTQPPMQARIRLGVDFIPPSSEELRRREAANKSIDDYNDRISEQSPTERLAANPTVEQELERARERIENADRRVDKLGSAEEVTAPREPPFDHTDVRFTEEEARQLREFVPKFFQSTKRFGSPRAIRALLFKVQLCRLLLQLRFPGKPEENLSLRDDS